MVGHTLRKLRLAFGFTQDALVAELRTRGIQLTKAALSKYECGKSLPSIAIVHALGSIYGTEIEAIVDWRLPPVDWVPAPAPRQSGKRRRERANALVLVQLGTVRELRRSLRADEADRFVPPIATASLADAERAATHVRELWGMERDEPIASLCTMIEALGGLVVEDPSPDPHFDALAGWADRRLPVVVVSGDVTGQRRRDAIAREIGHLLLDLARANPRVKKSYVSRFARAFLAPPALVEPLFGRSDEEAVQELGRLAYVAGLSIDACLQRTTELSRLDPADGARIARRIRSQALRPSETPPPIEEPAELARLGARALAAGILSRAQAARLTATVAAPSEALAEQLGG